MKKTLFIVVPLILMGYLVGITLIPRTNIQNIKAENNISSNDSNINKIVIQEKTNKDVPANHVNQQLNCKTCHACEYPTKEDPCLTNCPREIMISAKHSPKEGPDVVIIDQMSDNYLGVVFSHKMHAEMSDISIGCTGCHHYNTSGPVLNCQKCHENTRARENVSVPDLKSVYHRQCMTCHQQWSGETGCNNQCHLRKSPENQIHFQQSIKDIKGKSHPLRPTPSKMVWQTNYESGKIVTFFHDEHVQLFKLKCSDCHSNDNCVKCHSPKTPKDFSKPVDIKKSQEEHHKPCNDCHNMNTCNKCHTDSEMQPFNHGRSAGWTLKSYHSKLACTSCHGNQVPIKKLDNNCTSCHKNFLPGKFDHKLAGLTLSENHKDFECNNCHKEGNFAKVPLCTDCHDDKSFPKNLPGVKK